MSPVVRLVEQIINRGLERFGRYYSSYRGIVKEISEDGTGRIKVAIPQLTGSSTHPHLAWPVGVYSGADKGLQLLPDIGDIVWVEFEYGDVKRPLWKHGYKTLNTIKDEDKDPKIIWFKTPEGYRVEINRTTKALTIKDPHNQSIVMNEKGISLVHNSKPIFLGSLDEAKEPTVLGETTQSKLESILDEVSNNNQLILDVVTQLLTLHQAQAAVSASTGVLAPLTPAWQAIVTTLAPMVTTLTNNQINIQKVKTSLPEIKSEVTKTD